MNKRHLTISTLLLLLLLIPMSYMLLKKIDQQKIDQQKREEQKREEQKVITIPQLKIESAEKPENILSQFKLAVTESKEKVVLSKEEEAQEVLDILKSKIESRKVTSQEEKIEEEKLVATEPKVVKPTTHNIVVAKSSVETKSITKESSIKKSPATKVVRAKPVKKHATLKKRPIPKPKKPVVQKVAIKDEVIEENQRLNRSGLSREEEVALYKEKIAQRGLEIVEVSENFEIKDPTSSTPDYKYFEPLQVDSNENLNAPLKFVKKLGVVAVSNEYEVKSVIPKKVEEAKEGIVDIPSATVETKELKKLKFVDTLEVVEVSPAFETTEADKYMH